MRLDSIKFSAISISNDLLLKLASPRLQQTEYSTSHRDRATSAKSPKAMFANLQLQRKDLFPV